jgi:hypothetical protein
VAAYRVRPVDVAILDELLAIVGEKRGAQAADGLCEACVQLFGVDSAAISIVFDGANIGTLGASGTTARELDELQFTLGEGPCLDAVESGVPILILDLADVDVPPPWSAYGRALLDHQIRGVYALPVMVAGQCVGSLDLFRRQPGLLRADYLTGVLVAADLAQLPFLDFLGADLHAAVTDPGSDAWAELNTLSRTEVSQATGVLVAQLQVAPAIALLRLRAHAYATGRSATHVARDILARRLNLEAD